MNSVGCKDSKIVQPSQNVRVRVKSLDKSRVLPPPPQKKDVDVIYERPFTLFRFLRRSQHECPLVHPDISQGHHCSQNSAGLSEPRGGGVQ
jgi:hypothetical protein